MGRGRKGRGRRTRRPCAAGGQGAGTLTALAPRPRRPLRSPQDEAWNMLVDHSPRSISDLLSEPTLKELMLHHVRTHLLPRTTRHNGNTRVYAHSSGAAYVLRQAACLRQVALMETSLPKLRLGVSSRIAWPELR